MRNTGVLFLLIGVFIFLNVGNFADVLRGRTNINFLNPKSSTATGKGSTFVSSIPRDVAGT
jgi:hypothetical protein